MDTFIIIAIVFWGLAIALIITNRALKVSDYRRRTVWKIVELSVNEFEDGKMSLSLSRWKALHKVSFDKMLWQFWKPLDKFYEGWDFNVTDYANKKKNA